MELRPEWEDFEWYFLTIKYKTVEYITYIFQNDKVKNQNGIHLS